MKKTVSIGNVIDHLKKGFKVRNRESGRIIINNPNANPKDPFSFLTFENGEAYQTFNYNSLYAEPESYELLDSSNRLYTEPASCEILEYEELLEERDRLLTRVKVLEDRLYKAVELLRG